MPKSKKSRLPLFDIRINSQDQDVILLKGSPLYAPPALLSGTIVLSVTEPLHVKKMRLKLYATMHMTWDEKYKTPKGQIMVKPFKTTKMVYCFDWDPINLEKFLDIHNPIRAHFPRVSSTNSIENIKKGIGFTTGTLTRSNASSSTNLRRAGSKTTLHSIGSSSSISAMSQLNPSHTNTQNSNSGTDLSQIDFAMLSNMAAQQTPSDPVVLQPGNYEFPFQCIIDGSVPESIVRLSGSSLVYRIQCVIERGRFSTPIITRKLLHVIRTLSPDNSELSETVAVDNEWPGKVDYSISVPTKAVAIGSSCQINISMSPLMKGLKLGGIKIKLVEIASFSTAAGNHIEEKTLTTKHVPRVMHDANGVDVWSEDSAIDQDGVFYRSHNMVLSTDRWEVNTQFRLPPSLESMTQDLDIASLCKVRHKLKFSVELLNPDDHVSELRATLPITLFVSPFIPTKVKTIDEYDDTFQAITYEDVSHHPTDENIIFQHEDLNATMLTNLHNEQQHRYEFTDNSDIDGLVPQANMNTQDLMAPPNYADRVYDKMFSVDSEVDFTDVTDIPPESLIQPRIADHIPVTIPIPLENKNIFTNIQDRPLPNIKFTQNFHNESAIDDDDDDADGSTADVSSPKRKPNGISGRKKPTFHMGGDDDDDDDEDEEDEEEKDDDEEDEVSTVKSLSIEHASSVIPGPAFNTGEQIPIAHTPNTNYLMTPGVLSPVQHLSRATSFVGDHPGTLSSAYPSTANMGSFLHDGLLKEMSKPPSYDIAVHSIATMKDLTPVYPNSESNIVGNLQLLDSRLNSLKIARQDQSGNNRPSMKDRHSKSTTALLASNNHQSSGYNHSNQTTQQQSPNHHHHHHPLSHTSNTLSVHGRNEHFRGKSQSTRTSPSISRNVSSTSLLSRGRFKMFGSSSSSHNTEMNNGPGSGMNARHDVTSPSRKPRSGSTTPQGHEGSYFPFFGNSSEKLTSPKSAHFAEQTLNHHVLNSENDVGLERRPSFLKRKSSSFLPSRNK